MVLEEEMRIEKIIFCQPIIIRSIWFSITYCVFEFLEAFLFFSNGSSKVYFYFRFKLTFLDFSFIWTCGALYHKKISMFLIHIEYQSICFEQLRYRVYVFVWFDRWNFDSACLPDFCVMCDIKSMKIWCCSYLFHDSI